MRTDLWEQFGDLAGADHRYLATVTAHNADGTASVTTAEGWETRVLGAIEGATVPYNVWIRDGRIDDTAPNFPIAEVTV